jgi:hypothetical protein
MIAKKELIRELYEEFVKVKVDLGFDASIEELEKAFRIVDGVVSSEFVSSDFSRQICTRILENFMSWHSYLNGLLMPSSGFLASQTEANLFSSKEDKELIWDLIKKTMEFSTRHSIIGFNRDKFEEAKFIDETLSYWNQTFSPALEKILKKSNEAWTK